MTNTKRLAELQRAFAEVPFMNHLGIVVEDVDDDFARVKLPYAGHNERSRGAIHGGAVASLADSVVAIALLSTYSDDHGNVHDRRPYATIEMKINYLGRAGQEDLWAEGRIIKRGRSIAVGQADILNNKRELLARALITYKMSE